MLFPLLTGDVRFGRLRGHNVKVQLVKQDSVSNYDFLFRGADTLQADPAPSEEVPEETAVKLAQVANQMLNNVLYKIPEDMDLRDFIVTYRDDSTEQRSNVPQAEINTGDRKSVV